MAGKWRGKGGQTQKQSPQMLELQLNECANHLFEGLMNWNAPTPMLENAWRDVMVLRSKCAQAYGVPGAGAAAARGGHPQMENGEVSWKSEFYQEFAKQHKTALTKEDCAWEVQETTPVEGERAGYICVLSCSGLESSYQGAEPSVSKKLAEHMAAKAAIKAEFKEAFARLSRGGGAAARGQQGKGGQKRKAEVLTAAAGDDNNAKSKLIHGAQLLSGGSLEKGAIVYECAEEGGQYTGTVTLQTYDPSVGYQGLPATTKKAAETQAAEAALHALATQINAAQEIHQAKKKVKNAESLKALKERTDAKKEAKEPKA